MTSLRYLLYLSYIGRPFRYEIHINKCICGIRKYSNLKTSRFRGAQRQVKRLFPVNNDPSTVQGRLEMGLGVLRSTNEPIIVLSSR